MLSTRQQWINDLEIEVEALSNQQQAMIQSLAKLQRRQDSNSLLNLKAELGEVERRLTLAKKHCIALYHPKRYSAVLIEQSLSSFSKSCNELNYKCQFGVTLE